MNIVPMTVPDTLDGAILLSIVDFFLSIVLIWGISLVLYIFPHLNKLGNITDESLTNGH